MHNKAILVGPCKDQRKLDYSKSTPIIFIDGGLKYRKKLFKNNNNWQSVGDGDSGDFKPNIKLNPHKNESDLFHALKLLPRKNIHWIETFGLFPELKHESRLDHRLLNLGEIYNYITKTGIVFLLNDKEIMLPAGENHLDIKGEFSIITFDDVRLKIQGQVKYPLKRLTPVKKLSSRTLSNHAQGRLSIECSHPFLLNLV